MNFPENGACVGQSPLLWDTDHPDMWRRGRAICLNDCTQRAECFAWVMDVEKGTSHGRSGIYAGLTPDDRADLAGNHNRRPIFPRCHDCNGRMSYDEKRPCKVRKQATDRLCLRCWTAARNPDPRVARPSEETITDAEALAAHGRWNAGDTDAATRRGEARYQTIRKRGYRAMRVGAS